MNKYVSCDVGESATKEHFQANDKRDEDYIYCILHTYEMMRMLDSYIDEDKLRKWLLEYVVEWLNIPKALFIERGKDEKNLKGYGRGITLEEKKQLIQEFAAGEEQRTEEEKQVYRLNKSYLAIPITHENEAYGTLLIYGRMDNSCLMFIKQLYALTLRNIQLGQLSKALLESRTKNDIANEVHDGVLQQLFAISCNLFALSKHLEEKDVEELKDEIHQNRLVVQDAMTEIRSMVYKMSWNKEGESCFVVKLSKYVVQMKRLYHANIELKLEGDVQLLSIQDQYSLYRIICESLANGLRHGKAKEILVSLRLTETRVNLDVRDDGIGFDQEKIIEKNQYGLGIKNMEYLTLSMGGEMEISSVIGKGTEIKVSIPRAS